MKDFYIKPEGDYIAIYQDRDIIKIHQKDIKNLITELKVAKALIVFGGK